MTGLPMEVRVEPDVQPVLTRRPPNVPIHWQRKVSEQLNRYVALGVIEPGASEQYGLDNEAGQHTFSYYGSATPKLEQCMRDSSYYLTQ